jgi:ATP-dependent Clp protease ATP-binding subunit ClpC
VILFDEIEKAHPEVFNLLLQILEEGELRDHLGHTVNFRSTVIILTSNAGVREISRESRLGFGTGSGILSGPEIEAAALSELKRIFSPEFLNRVDETIVFHPLEQKEIRRILALALGELEARLEEQGCILRITPSAEDILLQKGWDPKYGGRPLRRAIQRELEDPLALLLLEGAYPEGTVFEARGRGGNIVLRVKSSSLSFPSPDPTPSHLSLKCRL